MRASITTVSFLSEIPKEVFLSWLNIYERSGLVERYKLMNVVLILDEFTQK